MVDPAAGRDSASFSTSRSLDEYNGDSSLFGDSTDGESQAEGPAQPSECEEEEEEDRLHRLRATHGVLNQQRGGQRRGIDAQGRVIDSSETAVMER